MSQMHVKAQEDWFFCKSALQHIRESCCIAAIFASLWSSTFSMLRHITKI